MNGQQQHLPGIDPNELRYQDLLKKYPEPKTKAQAESFFRTLERDKGQASNVECIIKLRKDHDLMRVVLKTRDSQENDVKYERKVELPLDDPDEYEIRFIESAALAWREWIGLERDKYREGA